MTIKVKVVKEQVGLPGHYLIRNEVWTMDNKDTAMTHCYSLQGDPIGSIDDAHELCNKRGIVPRPRYDKDIGTNKQCTIGFCTREQKWYGWSHRAIFGFGVGSKCTKESSHYFEQERGEWTANNLDDAKVMAQDFARSVS